MLKIGHRGASGYNPENTLSSFEKAMELGVDMIELDVHVCKSGEVVVIHDDTINRTTNGKGKVRLKTLDELKNVEIKNGEKIPTLFEVLELVDKKVKVNIELKGENTAIPVLEIIEEFVSKKGWDFEDFLVSSFDFEKLREIKNPKVRIGVLSKGDFEEALKFAEEVKAYSIHLSLEIMNSEFLGEAHGKGFKVFVYTANEPMEVKKSQELGVDGIFSDYPDRL